LASRRPGSPASSSTMLGSASSGSNRARLHGSAPTQRAMQHASCSTSVAAIASAHIAAPFAASDPVADAVAAASAYAARQAAGVVLGLRRHRRIRSPRRPLRWICSRRLCRCRCIRSRRVRRLEQRLDPSCLVLSDYLRCFHLVRFYMLADGFLKCCFKTAGDLN